MVYVSNFNSYIYLKFILFVYNYNKYNLIFNCLRRLSSVVYMRNFVFCFNVIRYNIQQ